MPPTCVYCRDVFASMAKVTLECGHEYHVVCFAKMAEALGPRACNHSACTRKIPDEKTVDFGDNPPLTVLLLQRIRNNVKLAAADSSTIGKITSFFLNTKLGAVVSPGTGIRAMMNSKTPSHVYEALGYKAEHLIAAKVRERKKKEYSVR